MCETCRNIKMVSYLHNSLIARVAACCRWLQLRVILRVSHGKLHEMCILYVTSKRGPRRHILGFSMLVSCYNECTRLCK